MRWEKREAKYRAAGNEDAGEKSSEKRKDDGGGLEDESEDTGGEERRGQMRAEVEKLLWEIWVGVMAASR